MVVLANGGVVSIANDGTITNLGITNTVDVSCGNGYAYILDKNKNVYTFGDNTNGQLGNGGAVATDPTLVSGLTNTEIISAGEGAHGAVATFDGSIFTTGLNDCRQLGHGDTENKTNFEIVLNVAIESNVEKVVEAVGDTENVDIGLNISLNLKKDLEASTEKTISIVDSQVASLQKSANGTYNVTGESIGRTFLNATISGNINGVDRQFATNVEVRIVPEGGITVPQIKSGDDFSVALKADGSIETWGKNNFGQLGLGDTENRDEPVGIGLDQPSQNRKSIQCNRRHNCRNRNRKQPCININRRRKNIQLGIK